MPTYVMLVKLTDEGEREIFDSPHRLDLLAHKWRELGGKLSSIYRTLGEYDFVGLAEAPNDWCALKFDAYMAASGDVRTTTTKAYEQAEWSWLLNTGDDDIAEIGPPPGPTKKKGFE